MSEHDHSLHLLNCFLRGRLSRRDAIVRSAAAGIGVGLFSALARVGDGAAAQSTGPTGEVTWSLESNVPNVIPFGAIATANWRGKEFMYDSLVAWDSDLNVIPALAESWETPDDSTYVFHLRSGVTFHDGRAMTAADVVYSLNMAVNPPEPGVKVPYFDNVGSVEAIDDSTVRVSMSRPDPTLIGVLAWTVYSPIVPEGALDEIETLSAGIGTGPFRLIEFLQDDQIVYEAYPDFWEPDVPKVSKLTLKMITDEASRVAALRSQEVDGGTFSPDIAPTLESDDINIITGISPAARVIRYTMTEDVPWRDKRVRQAVSLVVDRQDLIEKVYGGEALMAGAIPPGFGPWPISDEELAASYAVDVERAQALMAEAGYADGFDVTMIAIAQPRDYTAIAEIVQEQVKQININVSVESLEIGAFVALAGEGNYEWASTGRGIRADPSGHVVDFRSGTANNTVVFGDGWKSDELDALYDEGLSTTDEVRRKEIYDEIQRILLDELPNMYLCVPRIYQAANSRLEGMYVFYGDTNRGLRTVMVAD